MEPLASASIIGYPLLAALLLATRQPGHQAGCFHFFTEKTVAAMAAANGSQNPDKVISINK